MCLWRLLPLASNSTGVPGSVHDSEHVSTRLAHTREMAPSRTAIDKAGAALRKMARNPTDVTGAEYEAARAIAEEYRSTFHRPTVSVNSGLRWILASEGIANPWVTQRIKRMPRIESKLLRVSTRLSQMQDIGGCRVVVSSSGEVDAVAARINDAWAVAADDDYRDTPRSTGYRALHLIVRRSDRLIEVQLRTTGQHRWAQAVEALEDLTGVAYKDGAGEQVLHDFLVMTSERIAAEEAGCSLSVEWRTRYDRVRDNLPSWEARGGGNDD